MRKQRGKKRQERGAGQPGAKGSFSNRPFRGLSLPEGPGEAAEPEAPPDPAPAAEESSDEGLFYLQEMAGVRPLAGGDKLAESALREKPLPRIPDDDALVMKELDDLVRGETRFDFADTDEYVEAAAVGLDRRIVKKLKRGDYSYQAHLDLHGMTRDEAREKVDLFIRRSVLEGKRCVLIVHGRGFGSKEGIPVLKNKLAAWLTRGAIGRRVLAYTSAMPYDGGTGAVYVLLRAP